MAILEFTEDYAINELKKCIKKGASEDSHIDADDILCEFLITLGYKKLVSYYKEVPKWYS